MSNSKSRWFATIELLERRCLLAATADIVFLLDESLSASPDEELYGGHSLQYWFRDMAPKLESKLAQRGIEENRYGLIGFGRPSGETGEPVSRAFTLDIGLDDISANDDVFGDIDEVLDALDQFFNAGAHEDGWDAVARATNLLSPESPQYVFREGAAVHLVLISDEDRAWDGGEINSSLGLEGLLASLRAANVTTTGLDLLDDAVVTVVAPTYYSDITHNSAWGAAPEFGADPVIGIDIHIADEVNVDLNSDDWDDDMVAGATDDIAYFRVNTDGSIYVDHRIANDAGKYMFRPASSYRYLDWRAVFDSETGYYDPLSDPESHEPFGQDQSCVSSHVYAMLGWESRGTVWDFDYFNSRFDQVQHIWIDKASVDQFTRAFVDDVFEKVRLQVVNFDGTGYATLEGAFAAMWSAATEINDGMFAGEERLFDLDGDGGFFDLSTGQIDQDDIFRLAAVYGTIVGDSNFDYEFDAQDFIHVFLAGEYEDGIADNSWWATGDWDGNLDFETGDFILVFLYSIDFFEQGYLDEDGDGIADYLPVWALDSSLNGTEDFYRPNWG